MSNHGKPMAPASIVLTEQPKRKRGRPRKQPQDPTGPLPPKKPRGRPKGSKKRSAVCGQMGHISTAKKPREGHENGFLSPRKNITKLKSKEKAIQVLTHALPQKGHLQKAVT